MPLFKKTKKKSPEQKYCENLIEQISFAESKGKDFIYASAIGREEDWIMTFCEQRNYEIKASHQNEGVVYYKIYGWND